MAPAERASPVKNPEAPDAGQRAREFVAVPTRLKALIGEAMNWMQRRLLVEAWATWCDTEFVGSNVVPLQTGQI